MYGVIAQSPSGAWSSGGAILTFLFPMLLFIGVAGALYVLYTKPEVAPGHRAPERPITYTAIPGEPTAANDENAEQAVAADSARGIRGGGSSPGVSSTDALAGEQKSEAGE